MNQRQVCARGRAGLGALLLHGIVCTALLCVITPDAQAAWSGGNWTEVFTSGDEVRDLSVASDGNGGTLAMILNRETYPGRAYISRLSRPGTELWGPLGKVVPFDIATSDQLRPVAIASDGSGGAYGVWQDWYTVSGVFHLARFDASGTQMWSVNVASAGSNSGTAGAQLVLEPGVGITMGYVDSSSKRLYATRYDPNGTFLWSTDVNLFYEHNIATFGGVTEFDMKPDGQGGVLFAWLRYDLTAYQNTGLYFEQIGAQRIGSTGNRLWGTDGRMVWQQPGFWHVSAYHAKIVNDGAGGAYVVTSGGSRAYGQHLNAAGTETWAAGGIVLQPTASTSNSDTDPQICSDGVGGLILVQYSGNIFAARVDINGTPLWGAPGIIAALVGGPTEFYDDSCIDADGFGGAVVGYHRWDNGAESLSGLRIDAFGTVLWNNDRLFDATGSDEIQDVHVVADGLGGAQYVWKRHVPDPPRKDDVYALGVNAQGLAPDPLLYGLVADAGEPGDVLPILLFGDYVDDSFGYDLRNGAASVPFTGVASITNNLVGGWIDLTGAAIGPWNLYATLGGGDRASLADAFGVGLRPTCTQDHNLSSSVVMNGFGTSRKMHYDAAGYCRFGFMIYHAASGEQLIYGGGMTPTGAGYGLLESHPGTALSDLAFTIDNLGRHVYAYVRAGVSQDLLMVHTYDGPLVPSRSADMSFTPELSHPVLAALPGGDVHIVVEQGSAASKGLNDLLLTDLGVTLVPMTNGANAHAPDLAVTPDGLAMVYVRDSWFPGVSELCLQHLRNGTWEAPVMLTFALSLTSPSVAWDGASGLLVAWILDNSGNGSAPFLQTTLVTNNVPGPIRTRATDGLVYRVQVDAQGPSLFYMLTQETGQPMQFFLRGGDGNVFYPKRRLNSIDDSDWPLFAAEYGGTAVGAMWQSYNTPSWGNAIMMWNCDAGVSTGIAQNPPRVSGMSLSAYPNPFNPSTRIEFTLQSPQWVRVQVFNVRGQLVRTLNDGLLPAGVQSLKFDGRDNRGNSLASGVYFAQLRPAVGAPAVVKLTLLK